MRNLELFALLAGSGLSAAEPGPLNPKMAVIRELESCAASRLGRLSQLTRLALGTGEQSVTTAQVDTVVDAALAAAPGHCSFPSLGPCFLRTSTTQYCGCGCKFAVALTDDAHGISAALRKEEFAILSEVDCKLAQVVNS